MDEGKRCWWVLLIVQKHDETADAAALLPPSTIVPLLPLLPSQTHPPISSLTLPSGLRALHTQHYSPKEILSRVLHRLDPDISQKQDPDEQPSTEPSLSVIDISAHEGLAIGLANDLMDKIEADHVRIDGKGVTGVVRDDAAGGGTRWYRDLISAWPVDRIASA